MENKKEYRYVSKPMRKKDAMTLVTGKPVFTDDIAPKDCLIVKVLRSPHAHAVIEEINTEAASKMEGIVCILTYKDVPDKRFTFAGQTFPEPSPYDRLILENRVRFVGDAVAIVAGKKEKQVDLAMKKIKVKYKVLDAVLDFHQAKDNPVLIHPEEDWKTLSPVGGDNQRNLCASGSDSAGDVDAVYASCDYTVEHSYHVKACQQAAMEPFTTYTHLDSYGRLQVVTSTQVPFHVRRILATALDIPKSRIRVIKPRIGGGFGSKQTVVSEVYPAIVTLKTGLPAKMIFSRYECQICSSPRHEMEVTVKIGAGKDGIIRAIDLYTLSNTGAYGEHGPTTVGLSGHKSIPLYGKTEAFRFTYDVVYTNRMSAGAYRGYGATQGIFALESAVNELAAKMNMDPVELRRLNMVREGQVMPAYYGELNASCALDRCMDRAAEMIGWDKKPHRQDMGNGKVRGMGVAMAMQGSGISHVDVGSVTLKINDDGFYSLSIGATDMGTGCDSILAQIAAEELGCSYEEIVVHGVDTDTSPYDTGSYASASTYVTGMAVVKACRELKEKIAEYAKNYPGLSLKDLANKSMSGNNAYPLEVTQTNSSEVSPPPFMVGMAEVEVDTETGSVEVLDYVAVVDCGTPINPNLVTVQTEGGILQGIGMTLSEDIRYSENGKMGNNSFMQYKIPTRMDIGQIRVDFENSYEETGPFGAKSIGEIVINTPAPAIAEAIYQATGKRFFELPILPEQVAEF